MIVMAFNERFCLHKDKMFFIQLQLLKGTPQMFLDWL